MKFFNFLVTFVLMAISTTTMATDAKKHDFYSPSAHSLHVATDSENALTFLSKTVALPDERNLHGYSNSVLNNPKDIFDTEFSLGNFGEKSGHESRGYHKKFESDSHDNIVGMTKVEHFNHKMDDEFEGIFHERKDYEDLRSSLNNHFCGHPIPAPVPEPETYAMMVAGLLLLGVAKRNKA